MRRLCFAKLYIGKCHTVDDHVRTVDLTETEHFIGLGDVKLILICIQSFNFQRV